MILYFAGHPTIANLLMLLFLGALLDITKPPSEDALNIISELTSFLEAERAQAPPSVVMKSQPMALRWCESV